MATSIKGLDISMHQGASGLPQSAFNAIHGAGYQFVLMKATEGVGYVDPAFKANWARAKAAHLVVGAYHFARPDLRNGADKEARFFVSVVKPMLTRYDLVALDLEVGVGNLAAWEKTCLDTVRSLLGFNPLRYSYLAFFAAHGLPRTLENYGNWIAAYQATKPNFPLAIWQNTSHDQVGGINGYVDEDIFYGSRDQLIKYGKP